MKFVCGPKHGQDVPPELANSLRDVIPVVGADRSALSWPQRSAFFSQHTYVCRWFRINDFAIQFFADAGSTEQDIQAAALKMFTREAVAHAELMPGTNGGFTMAVFSASVVPVGAPIYDTFIAQQAAPAQVEKHAAELKADNEQLRTALRFYARKKHIADPDDELCLMDMESSWMWHSSAVTSERGWADNSAVLMEDGSIAKSALLGQVIDWNDEEGEDQTPKPLAGEPT